SFSLDANESCLHPKVPVVIPKAGGTKTLVVPRVVVAIMVSSEVTSQPRPQPSIVSRAWLIIGSAKTKSAVAKRRMFPPLGLLFLRCLHGQLDSLGIQRKY